MENLYYVGINETINANNHSWSEESLSEPPRLVLCHGRPPPPTFTRGLDLSSLLLFLSGVLLFLLSVFVVVKRWRHYVAVRRHRLLAMQALARGGGGGGGGSTSGCYPGTTLRTVVVTSSRDARNKNATHVVGVVPGGGVVVMPGCRPTGAETLMEERVRIAEGGGGGGGVGGIPSAGLEFMPATKLPPYIEHPLPPSYEDSERMIPRLDHV